MSRDPADYDVHEDGEPPGITREQPLTADRIAKQHEWWATCRWCGLAIPDDHKIHTCRTSTRPL